MPNVLRHDYTRIQDVSRAVLISVVIGAFSSVQLAFAWTTADHIRPILGHTNFFSEFDVCFFGRELTFEVRPKSNNT